MEVILILVGVALVIYVSYVVAMKFADIAEMKGHDGNTYFWFTFLLGICGMLMVIALPYEKKTTGNTTGSATPSKESVTCKATTTKDNTWICGNCRTENSMNYGQCKKCGKFRSN